MSAFENIFSAWEKDIEVMHHSEGFRRILQHEVTVEHYKSIFRQIFHHARENPQIQVLATVFFRGEQRAMVKPFFRHATSEIGHDQLALNDLKTLGVDTEMIPYERPLPATTALLAYAFYQIQFRNPVGYLGYLFHLEFMPTRFGRDYMASFLNAGVPPEAMTFIQDHTTIDEGHNKFMQSYIAELIKTKDDLDSVIYAAKITSRLYGAMVKEAIDQADQMYLTSATEKTLTADTPRTFNETIPTQTL